MSDFIVDESKFLLSEEEEETIFEEGFRFPCGIKVGSLDDSAECWELYTSQCGNFNLLVVLPELKDKWVNSGLLTEGDFQKQAVNGNEVYVLFSRTSSKLMRLTGFKAKTKRAALALLSAFTNTRLHDIESNLRDSIYLEDRSILLPIYSLVGKLSDKALYLNAIRSKNENEHLDNKEDLQGGVNLYFVKKAFKSKNLFCIEQEGILKSGVPLKEYFDNADESSLVLSPVILEEHFQLVDTTSENYVLILDDLWGKALVATSLISQMSFQAVVIDRKQYFILFLSKSKCIEQMNDRNWGINEKDAFDLSLAIRKTRALIPNCSLKDSLYVQQYGYLFPLTFNSHEEINDRALLIDVLEHGPFAMSNFMNDVSNAFLDII